MTDKKKKQAPNTKAQAAIAVREARGPALRIARLRGDEPWFLPKRAFDSDAGLDLYVTLWTTIHPGARVQLPHNFALSVPPGHFGLILPRSSTFHQKGLIVHPGIIDEGYRGEVMTIAYNPGTKSVYVGDNERISQLLILPVIRFDLVDVRDAKKLPAGDRSSAGFGSTGGFGLPEAKTE